MSLKIFNQDILPIKDKLYRFALRITGSGFEAEDVVQEVMIKLWNKRTDLSQYASIEAWSMRMTKNLSIDKLRSKHRRTEDLTGTYDLAGGDVSPHELAEQQDTIYHIRQLMNQLPEKQKMVMQLRDIEDMSYQEIADVMDIPMNQVKVNLFRARKAIRNKLTQSNLL